MSDEDGAAEQRDSRLLSGRPSVDPSSSVREGTLRAWTSLGPRCSVFESSFGDYSSAAGDVVYAGVGKCSSIASYVRLNPGNHPTWRVTQHHLTYRRRGYGLGETVAAAFFDWRRVHRGRIGHAVWIGHGAFVAPGATVGNGAVVGAGAIVSRDEAPYPIVVGVPARPPRPRFSAEVAARLEAIARWDRSRQELEERLDDPNDRDGFLERYGG